MTHQLTTQRRQSEQGLALVRKAAKTRLSPIVGDEPLAIYVTGSFGRLEARFQKDPISISSSSMGPPTSRTRTRPSQLTWFELAGELIRIARELDFEEFSRDGAFLQAHNVWHIGRELGSQHEDAENGFTARLLLLLESRYVLNEELYLRFMTDTIDFYYGDYRSNRGTFRPTFLINDILRFWRTLCLNYEHKRNRKRSETGIRRSQCRLASRLRPRQPEAALQPSVDLLFDGDRSGRRADTRSARASSRAVPSQRRPIVGRSLLSMHCPVYGAKRREKHGQILEGLRIFPRP